MPSQFTDKEEAPAIVKLFTSFGKSYRFLKLPLAGSIRLHSGMTIKPSPSNIASLVELAQSRGFAILGSIDDNRH